jgi:hypothetical protein
MSILKNLTFSPALLSMFRNDLSFTTYQLVNITGTHTHADARTCIWMLCGNIKRHTAYVPICACHLIRIIIITVKFWFVKFWPSTGINKCLIHTFLRNFFQTKGIKTELSVCWTINTSLLLSIR